jgi:signal transduction histidine kinase
MKTRINELNTALQYLDSDTWDNQLLPKLTEDDPFSEVFESINKLSEKVKESNKWFHKFEKIFKTNELKEIDEYDKDNSLENQLIHTSKMAQIGIMVTEITHEMTQPLTYLNNYLYTLSDDLTTSDPILNDKLKNNLEIASKEVNRLIKLVNHIQEFSRKDLEQIRIPIEFSKVIDQTLYIMDDQIQSSNIRLIKNIQKDLPYLNVNPNDMEQVFINLLQNAIDSLKEIENNAVLEIVIYHKKEQNKFFIEINDNGKGVDEQIRNKIFTPFFTTKPAGEGTGLGLNIIQKIIEKYSGTINCRSSDGQGASFIISLPL